MDPQTTLIKLNELIQHCQKAPFYQERLPRYPLQSFEEFRKIPLTTKEDLRGHSPYGFVCVPQSKWFQYHESFGTTGTPVSVWLTRNDYRINAEELSLWGVRFQGSDIVMVRFPYSISAIAHTVTTAAQMQGACVVPAGARSKVSPFPRVVSMLRKLKVTVLTCLPLQALLIAETAQLMGLEPRGDFPDLRAIGTAGETLALGRRKTIEKIWGVPVFDNYGLTEVGAAVVDCWYQRPHPVDDYFYFEILQKDLTTLVEPGTVGYLVITTLRREGMPLVRYLTGDLARFIPGKCPCGAKGSLEIRGRAEEVIQVKDRALDLWEIQEIASRLTERRFWIVSPQGERLEMIAEEEKAGERIVPRVLQSLEKELGIRLSVKLVPKGTLYDRTELLSIGEVGKPRYLYSAQEVAEQKYLHSVRV